MDQAKVKVLLKRLFAVAEDDASADGEIDNAMAAAANLMSLHQIERDELAGEYKWSNGDMFRENTKKRTGKLVLCSS